ncbi:lethal(2) giant larvae protein homolog 1 isoform X5 [Vespa velutina]|uniref:lethal(2) giant larvae protein homolog 1 isoform X5 n=1 Tax=Vespa velutina TaxID=202808 RepID=UPI001FB3D8DB|nr:lethal(2) giant larvae protein homolog 1 isoform X5 [Vespa velutina]
MLKFIRGKGQQPTAERQKLQKDLFAFRKTVQHGFPNKPTAFAWDPSLRLMIIGTTSGAIKVFGRPGVEFYGQHSSESGENAVTKIVAIPNETFVSTQQLESVHFISESRFVSSHNDGSYTFWSPGSDAVPDPTTPYGPFPCKAITKILVYPTAEHGELVLFSGGMQRASYGDRHTITVMTKDKHVVFDFTSKVIDFFTVFARDEDGNEIPDNPEALIVLAEEEIVAIDLTNPQWKMMALPYLVSLHASAVTCSQHVPNVPEELWDSIMSAGKAQTEHLYSDKEWPIDGGTILCNKPENPDKLENRELLLTGHEDGTVRFWNASDVSLTPLYKYNSSILFTGEHLDVLEQPPEDDEDEWPPFRKVGTFDPYSDDPRLAVKKVLLCPLSSTLVIAGTAGHVVTAVISSEPVNKEIKAVTMNIVNDRDGFIWKGYDHLPVRTASISFAIGFQPQSILQLYPPAAVTALAMHSEWGLLATGTAHGLAVFDYTRVKPVTVKCTLNPNDLSGAGDTPISRRKSFKKSLRESFRRLRKGRSQRRTNTNSSPTRSTVIEKKKEISSVASSPSADLSPMELKPVERQVEARPVDDALGSMVRCLYFARSYIISMQNTTPTLWAGTNNGTVYVFTLAIPAGVRRTEEDVNCTLGKEIQLKHRAPVIAITILDGSNVPLPEPFEAEKGVSPGPDMTSPHRVLIASEEQFKIFNLPSLKPNCKYKLTAHEGSRVRKTGFAKFTCPIDSTGVHVETCLLCLTNLGDCLILSIPELRRQLNAAAIKREDINGISSLTFTKSGEALYLHSSSELQRISLSATKVTKAHCTLNLPPSARVSSETSAEEQAVNEDATENGVVGSSGEESPKEPSLQPSASITEVNGEDERQDLSSVGDITIDSVKDHLLNNSIFRNAPSSEELHNRLTGLKMEVTS